LAWRASGGNEKWVLIALDRERVGGSRPGAETVPQKRWLPWKTKDKDIKEMKIILNGEWNGTAGDKYWRVANELKLLLKKACGGTRTKVAVVGLNALLWYQSVRGVGPQWSVELGADKCNYVCLVWGPEVSSKEGLKVFVAELKERMKERGLLGRVSQLRRNQSLVRKEDRWSGRVSPSTEEEEDKWWNFIVKGGAAMQRLHEPRPIPVPTWEVAVAVKGWKQMIEFVQVGEEWDVLSALERLHPLNVERVAFDIRREVFLAEERVKKSICEGKAKIDWIGFEFHGCPSMKEIAQVKAGLQKMTDFSRRNYKFEGRKGVSLKADGVVMV
jgi:hypothetical protein